MTEINIDKELLERYIEQKIERANYLYHILCNGQPSPYSVNDDNISSLGKRIDLHREYETLTMMFRHLNIFNWLQEDDVTSINVNID